ncbi:helix-turn-helix transcriptional regulator [Candidatus Bipolaricaulota bacterium]|nr:helix-turn-helix transcriptional regulator [Candidatus Bipolaricaulota bacterium]
MRFEKFDMAPFFTIMWSEMGEIGKFIRTQRKLRGWTLQELGEHTDLSVSFLSQVERGISSLSILSLNAICEALEIPLSDLYTRYDRTQNTLSDASPEILKVHERPDIQISSGSIKYQFLSGEFPERTFEILIGEIPPNYHYPPAAHDGEEFGYVLEGVLNLSIGDEVYSLGSGDSYHFLSTTPHGYQTEVETGARVLWVQSLKYSAMPFSSRRGLIASKEAAGVTRKRMDESG